MPSKRITAPFYTETKTGIHNIFRSTRSPEGYLYSKGRYITKITAEDLPEHYIYGWIFKTLGYISVLGVKDVVYKPNYHINHLHKDDWLFISYDKPIVETKDKFGYDIRDGYEALLYGHMILDFIRAVRKYQSYDIEPIAEEVKKERGILSGKISRRMLSSRYRLVGMIRMLGVKCNEKDPHFI